MHRPSSRSCGIVFLAHPWHGVSAGDEVPRVVNTFIELVPTDTVKYEVDKATGHLKLDRPQKYSNFCPTPYGFIPRTYCGAQVGAFCSEKTGRPGIEGDGDPLDICVLTEKPITHGNILVRAIPIGGLRMIDGVQADDKIVAVLAGDAVYGELRDISESPRNLIDRLSHYFLTYKDMPHAGHRNVEITHAYGAQEAFEVIRHSISDYQTNFDPWPPCLTASLIGEPRTCAGSQSPKLMV